MIYFTKYQWIPNILENFSANNASANSAPLARKDLEKVTFTMRALPLYYEHSRRLQASWTRW